MAVHLFPSLVVRDFLGLISSLEREKRQVSLNYLEMMTFD